ncbi:MAG: hypothetical protein A3A83_03335 [Candidatus Doudnabacteria bacterium RIFCSPLOWO2_01_FULL_48_57]|nr:MAG: hypothetical protein A2668_00740 [Candidatus Doudnabacteria bacterium RIFCSPHIGHO2_01_FULL_48_180]OGE98176.1 MAG: hypothetical protein A3A83_03335 [Candidatus Doudnabacteria bacterium RIFCSPLOWO2_01_FULL_48_57]
MKNDSQLRVKYVPLNQLHPHPKNPRIWDAEARKQLKESLEKFGQVDPLIVNSAPGRENIIIGGNFRYEMAKELGYTEIAVVYICVPDEEKELELLVRLNKNTGEFDWKALAAFDEKFLGVVGFSSEELDEIFPVEENPEVFDLEKELKKLDIESIEIQKGDVWQLGNHKLMCGDSTVEDDIATLMNGEDAAFCLTDPPYILDYLKGKKKNGKATEGFGLKRDRRYLETESLPPDFTERWMGNVYTAAAENFSIIVFENWKNVRTIWGVMEQFWKVKNMIVWHLPNRVQGFAAKYKFFNKHDIAMVGASKTVDIQFNLEPEEDGLQNEYETALFATGGKPHWEPYQKGKKICPTDFIEFHAADEKSSGQGIIFGTKPIEILIPYLKVLTKRGDLVIEPFGGSGSTLIACEKMKRRCNLMEKSAVYAEVIRKRWEKLTGLKAVKIQSGKEPRHE